MPLTAGTLLGSYEIVSPLGAGGMGEVYRAADTKLGRQVAIKVLPAEVAEDAERLSRFRREAHLLASLNHPNIAAIHGLEESDGKPFLVLELVEGEDIAGRLGRGKVPTKEALEIAKQIAEALEEAHSKGVVHRDLKPANVKLTPDGRVKVLDFGLAKAYAGESAAGTSSADISESPTIARSGTLAGVILGTAAYMSPEQARGKAVDGRADIWAFGVVLFEMLTGRRLFKGETVSDVLASVMKDEPDWQALPKHATPAALRRLLERCLCKDPRNRLQHMGDVRLELVAAATEPVASPGAVSPSASRARRALPWGLALLGLVSAAAALWLQRPDHQQQLRPMTRAAILLPKDAPLAPSSSFYLSVGRPALALAPDGSVLVYVALVEGARQLFRREMRTAEIQPLPGTADAQGPFFSPESEWVGFFAEGKLKKIRLEGGEAQVLADAVWGHGGEWGEDGFIYFCPTENRGVTRVPAAGGPPEAVTRLAPTDFVHAWPARLPGREQLLVTRLEFGFDAIGVARIGSAEPPATLIERASAGRYTSTGHLVFAREGRLLATPYDGAARQLKYPPTVLLEGVRTEDQGAVQAAWSDEGTLVYAPGSDVGAARFVWTHRDGRRSPVPLPKARYGAFAVSPSGSVLAYVDSESRLWLYDLDRGGAPQLLTPGEQGAERLQWSDPVWEPGRAALFAGAVTPRGFSIFRVALEGSARAPVEVIPQSGINGDVTAEGLLHGRGGSIVFVPRGEREGTLKLDQSRPVVALPGAQLAFPAVSPDGSWLAYVSDESGHWEIYVTSFPGAEVKRRVSFAGGEEPRWNPDGREIVYRFGSKWYSVAFASQPQLALGQPRLLFDGPFVNVPGYSWDLSPDGQRFLVLENPDAGRPLTELVVVTGFFDELRRKVPAAAPQ